MTGAAAQPFTFAGPEGSHAADRRRQGIELWRRRSRLIHLLRRALPASIAAIVILLVGWMVVGGILSRIGDVKGGDFSIHMTNARFYGRDDHGQPYLIGAAEAARDNEDFQRIWLTRPTLTLDLGSARATHVVSEHGVYREDDHIVRLRDHVVVRDGTGDSFFSEQAIIDTVHGVVTGPAAVRGTGPGGEIAADSFVAYNQGQQVVFRGNVHSIIKQR
jgi:lipopolysaccharide export system protein LptC